MPGCGALVAATILGRVGDVDRFATHHAFAMLAGVAPIPASSGQVRRMRLNRGGNRQLNRALYTIALTQIPDPSPGAGLHRPQAGRGQELGGGHRCLKRHLARVVFHGLRAGASVPAHGCSRPQPEGSTT